MQENKNISKNQKQKKYEFDLSKIQTILQNHNDYPVQTLVDAMASLEREFYTNGFSEINMDDKKTEYLLLLLFERKEWMVRGKALITLGRVGRAFVGDELLKILKETQEPWWQLQILDSWWQLPVDDRTRVECLSELIVWADQPVTVRGLVWLLRELGIKTETELLAVAKLFVEYALDKKTMMVKDEFMNDAWFSIADKLTDEQKALIIEEYPRFKVWLNFRYPEENNSHYSLYPSPDYLWQCALEYSVDKKQFKKLYFKPRKKA